MFSVDWNCLEFLPQRATAAGAVGEGRRQDQKLRKKTKVSRELLRRQKNQAKPPLYISAKPLSKTN